MTLNISITKPMASFYRHTVTQSDELLKTMKRLLHIIEMTHFSLELLQLNSDSPPLHLQHHLLCPLNFQLQSFIITVMISIYH